MLKVAEQRKQRQPDLCEEQAIGLKSFRSAQVEPAWSVLTDPGTAMFIQIGGRSGDGSSICVRAGIQGSAIIVS